MSGCGLYALHTSNGSGQTAFNPPRVVHPTGIALPEGYRIEPIVTGHTFPIDVDFDEAGRAYVTEAGYSYGEIGPRRDCCTSGQRTENHNRDRRPQWSLDGYGAT
ncbi:MAG: hypothetical protein M3120_03585 [Pseudomonadota bacterium]|nr:hypothetical protein [Pseudomonadota bacterium]